MFRKNLVWIAPGLLLMAACSRQPVAPVAAQRVSPEPVDRSMSTGPANTLAAAPPNQSQVFTPSQPPPGMYATNGGTGALPGYAAASSAVAADASAYAGSTPPAAAPPSTQPEVYGRTTPPMSSYGEPAPLPNAATEPAPSTSGNGQPGPPPADYGETAPEAMPPSGPSWDAPVLPAGTTLHVRLDEALGTKHDVTGERFYASLAKPVVYQGRVLLPVGTRFVGHLTESKPSGRLKGRAVLAIRLDGFKWRGREFSIATSSIVRETRGRKRHDLKWIAGSGGFGALIGAVAGGGGGALIGGAAGAGAGTAGALLTHKKQLYMRAETGLTFKLRRPVQL